MPAPDQESEMPSKRLSLFHYDLVRELCETCRKERFHFVPTGTAASTGTCRNCGGDGQVADLSDTSIMRLVTQPNGEVVIVPVRRL
jgi:hypothetical protein